MKMNNNTEHFLKEINKIIDFYFPYEIIIFIQINNLKSWDPLFRFLPINGIYFLCSDKKIIYIGISSNIGDRLKTHAIKGYKENIDNIMIIRFQADADVIAIESRLIDYFKPYYNKRNHHLDWTILPLDFDLKKYVQLIKERLGLKD